MRLIGEDHPKSKLRERDVVLLRTVKIENYDRTQSRIIKQRRVSVSAVVLARLGYTWAHLNSEAEPRWIRE
jgi:hypothetical protein